jgi:hypothetical protein
MAMARYELLLRNGTVVDPTSAREGVMDLAVAEGRIAAVAPGIDPAQAGEVFDVTGQYVLPGLVDLHVHASAWLGGRPSHKMLAAAGVTTALDMSGPLESVTAIARDYGAGLNLASITYVRPGHTVRDEDPSAGELESLLDKVLAEGSLGLKLLGGHYPLTPEAIARAIEAANRRRAYIAFHAGSKRHGSDIDGCLEAVALAGGNSLHLAHVNSYCRGLKRDYMAETEEVIAALVANPRIRTESYLSPLNGTSAKCSGGTPESLVTRRCLQTGGFAATEAGMEAAILAGWAQINVEAGGQMTLGTGPEAAAYWRGMGTDTTVSFSVNPPEPRLRLATAKRPDGGFVVDAISTDGGGIPRNVMAAMGLPLVRLQALTMREFVLKTSYNPAQILGLVDKGHFRDGADADVTVVDPERQRPVLAVANGRVIMHRGYVCGSGCTLITTAAGAAAVRKAGLTPLVVDLARSAFYPA